MPKFDDLKPGQVFTVNNEHAHYFMQITKTKFPWKKVTTTEVEYLGASIKGMKKGDIIKWLNNEELKVRESNDK